MEKIVFLSWAWISAESWIPTFRGDDWKALWNSFNVYDVSSAKALIENRDTVLKFYDDRRKELIWKKPNQAHIQIANLQKRLWADTVKILTWNVDDLFEKAWAKEVKHLHGKMWEAKCSDCDIVINIWDKSLLWNDYCPRCHNKTLRPNVVMFGEASSVRPIAKELEHFTEKDHLLVIWTSGAATDVNAIVDWMTWKSTLINLAQTPKIDWNLFTQIYYGRASLMVHTAIMDLFWILKEKK